MATFFLYLLTVVTSSTLGRKGECITCLKIPSLAKPRPCICDIQISLCILIPVQASQPNPNALLKAAPQILNNI